jgi:hypothetical protein
MVKVSDMAWVSNELAHGHIRATTPGFLCSIRCHAYRVAIIVGVSADVTFAPLHGFPLLEYFVGSLS